MAVFSFVARFDKVLRVKSLLQTGVFFPRCLTSNLQMYQSLNASGLSWSGFNMTLIPFKSRM